MKIVRDAVVRALQTLQQRLNAVKDRVNKNLSR